MPRTAASTLVSPVPRAADSDRRRTSASVVLRSVLEHGPVARSTIARLTGLSPASVTEHCARLAGLGLIHEEAAPAVRTGSAGRMCRSTSTVTGSWSAGCTWPCRTPPSRCWTCGAVWWPSDG